MVNRALTAQLCFIRHHGHAVRLHAAIATALANILVDEHPLIRVREQTALTTAALLGGAGLDIDDRADAFMLAVGLLHVRHLVALMHFDPLETRKVHVFLLVIDHGDVLHAHRLQLCNDAVGIQIALVVLTTRHGDGVIVEDFVGDVGSCRECGTDRLHAGMVIGAVTEILEHVFGIRERRLTDPVRALTAHVGKAGGLAVHPLHHIVTADARIGARAFGHFGRGVMRAARAIIRQTRGDILGIVRAARLVQRFQPGADTIRLAALFQQNAANLLGDQDRIQRTTGREQLFAMLHARAALVPSIDPAVRIVEQRFFNLHFDQLALFFDHDHQIEPIGPFVEALHVQREGLTDLIGGDPKPFGFVLVNVEQAQRMNQIEPVLTRRGKADLGPAFAPHAFVHLVGVGECLGRETLIVDHPRFLQMRSIAQADAQTAVRHVELRRNQLHPVRIAVHHTGRLNGVLHRLQAHPKTRETAQRPTINAVIKNFLNTGRRNHGHVGIHHRPFGLVQHGRGFARMVIPHRHQHTTMRRSARHIRMAHHITGTVDPRPFAVPQTKYTVVFAFAAQFRLLAAPKHRRREIFVQPRLKTHAMLGQLLLSPLHLQVNRAQWATPVASHIACGIEPRCAVAC